MPSYDKPTSLAQMDQELIRKLSEQPNDYEKFAKIKPNSTFEENLILTHDKNEIVFQVAEEVSQNL